MLLNGFGCFSLVNACIKMLVMISDNQSQKHLPCLNDVRFLSFLQTSHVKRHMAVHMERRPYVCDICGRGFAYPCELKSHVEKHKRSKDNMCDTCGAAFDNPIRLKAHVQVSHRDEADLTCKECGKRYTYPSQLRDHMIKHSGKRPYMCGECGMEFMKVVVFSTLMQKVKKI